MASRLAAAPQRETEAGASETDGLLTASRDAPVGGQAVLEGVMMRGVANWAVAVRKPVPKPASSQGVGDSDGEAAGPATGGIGDIEVTCFPLESALARHRWLRLPIIRGIVALGGSLTIGFKALGIAANAQLPPGEGEEEPQEISGGLWMGTIVLALAFAIGVFFLLPLGLTSLVKQQLHSSVLFWVVEGLIRTAIFLGYLLLLTRIKDLRRVFDYHGAEHKTISCFEAGLPLTPADAQRFSRLHPRCGTSFLLVVWLSRSSCSGRSGCTPWYWLILIPRVGRAPDSGDQLRADQVRRPQPPPSLGARDHVARAEATAADHPGAGFESACGRDRRAAGSTGKREDFEGL